MFLITTADQRFWKTDEKILFLGEWCKIYEQKHVWSKLDYEVLPYHWDDRSRLPQEYPYIRFVYEKYLQCLAARLNEIHGVSYSIRYWRILLGPWLGYFIQILYDRYLSIRAAIDSGLVTHTWLPPLKPDQWVARDYPTARDWGYNPSTRGNGAKWRLNDQYNQYLYGRIIKRLGNIPYEVKGGNLFLNSTPLNNPKSFSQLSKRMGKKALGVYSRLVPDSWNKIVFVFSYLDPWDLIRLQLSLGQLPYPYPPDILPRDFPLDKKLRESLKFSQGASEFEFLLDELLGEQIPTVYVEGYSDMHQRSLKAFPKRPKAILTANGFISVEGFKFWTAHQVSNGAKFLINQHGGNFGSDLWVFWEDHAIRISDRYFTWGWEGKDRSKVIPCTSGKLTGVKRKIKPDANGDILWVLTSQTRYFYVANSYILGPQLLKYIKDQESFARAVSPEVHELLLMRLFLIEYGWNEEKRFRDMDPSPRLYQGIKSIYQQLNKSRLCIYANNGTVNLETFAADFPTIIFWHPDHCELRESARPYFDGLRQAGILHYTPESAAAKVNEIYQDPISWWNSPETQEAKNQFCHQFARTSDTWLSEWKEKLLKIIRE